MPSWQVQPSGFRKHRRGASRAQFPPQWIGRTRENPMKIHDDLLVMNVVIDDDLPENETNGWLGESLRKKVDDIPSGKL